MAIPVVLSDITNLLNSSNMIKSHADRLATRGADQICRFFLVEEFSYVNQLIVWLKGRDPPDASNTISSYEKGHRCKDMAFLKIISAIAVT